MGLDQIVALMMRSKTIPKLIKDGFRIILGELLIIKRRLDDLEYGDGPQP